MLVLFEKTRRQRSAIHPELIFPWWCLSGAVKDEKIQVMPHNFAVIRPTKGQSKKTKESRRVNASMSGLSEFSFVQLDAG